MVDNNNLPDYAALILTFAGTVVAPCLGMAVKWFIDWRHIKVTEQQRQIIFSAVDTAAGLVLNGVRMGTVKIGNLHSANPEVQRAVDYVLTRAPTAAKCLGFDPVQMGNMVVGKVSRLLHEDPTTPTVLPPDQVTPPPVVVAGPTVEAKPTYTKG